MRIIAGEWRGRKLAAPKGDLTRPTADRTRETLFNMLASRLGTFDGLVVADLFAGSGALGIEALSRGAASCLFVENDAGAIDVIRANIAAVGARDRAEVRRGSVMDLGPVPAPYDLVLLDPPYGTGAAAVALDRMGRLGWIGPATLIAAETSARETVDVRSLEIEAERKVGKGKLWLLRKAAGTPGETSPA
ncbi:16S rRNA (guanine(966)-N(2))-methyltransferase RsmD [Altererythrobacter aerius]|uniref:16S rRNA (Guanine(966)-N(2))-methyltransferase RsmD n=1 Tax=Tsuneonella aeria TaxID=1837929 RepID=A0A6I4TBA9_9SPHN|nr:16S rRNA (guanine(966)-N(2))-methyltransferase RsmD [Tsuneonella aeria]MXO73876.1 16S rRNA (guanine(966)-N(2))-methyltransferase RsmD [Tsuneonella aeria]